MYFYQKIKIHTYVVENTIQNCLALLQYHTNPNNASNYYNNFTFLLKKITAEKNLPQSPLTKHRQCTTI